MLQIECFKNSEFKTFPHVTFQPHNSGTGDERQEIPVGYNSGGLPVLEKNSRIAQSLVQHNGMSSNLGPALYKLLAISSIRKENLVLPVGLCPSVGVAKEALGGSFGHFSNLNGMVLLSCIWLIQHGAY